MKQKLFTILFTLLVVSVETTHAWDYTKVPIGDLSYNLDATNETAEIADGEETYLCSGDLVIPTTVEYNGTFYTVTSIENSAFKYNRTLTSIEIPNTVTSIGDYTFQQCYYLAHVTIGDGVTEIGYHTFSDCPRLTSVTIGQNVTTIRQWAFYKSYALTSIDIPNSVTSIEKFAFQGCTGLTSVKIGNGVTILDAQVFSGCTKLNDLSLGEGISSIDPSTFENCTNIKKVYLNSNEMVSRDVNPSNYIRRTFKELFGTQVEEYIIGNKVKKIGDGAFGGCTELISVEIPNSVESIGGGAFSGCSNLTSVKMPTNIISSIGDWAFKNCSSLTSLRIPEGATGIGYEAFYNCNNLKTINIPSSITSVGYQAFYNCSSLASPIILSDRVTSIGAKAFYNCSNISFVSIGNGVSTIEANTFKGAAKLDTIYLGPNVKTIKEYAFSGCTNISTIYSYRPTPPVANEFAFDEYLSRFDCYVHVLANSVDMYKAANIWKDFYNIEPITSDKATVTDGNVIIKAGDDYVTITWPKHNNAAQYSIEIYKDEEEICSLTFNAKGQLTGIAFAPSRGGSHAPEAELAANGMQFTVNGLDYATIYNYQILVMDDNEDTIVFYDGKFGTTGAPQIPTLIDTATITPTSQKLLRNGQLLIQKGNHIYTLTGSEIK